MTVSNVGNALRSLAKHADPTDAESVRLSAKAIDQGAKPSTQLLALVSTLLMRLALLRSDK